MIPKCQACGIPINPEEPLAMVRFRLPRSALDGLALYVHPRCFRLEANQRPPVTVKEELR